MLGARALFAFHIGESTEIDGRREPSADALLGAMMHQEMRAVELQFAENFAKWAEMWVKVQKARGRKK